MKEKILDRISTESQQEELSMTVNPPFRGKQFIANKKLTKEEIETLERVLLEDEQLLFVVLGDLDSEGQYARTFLSVTDKYMKVMKEE